MNRRCRCAILSACGEWSSARQALHARDARYGAERWARGVRCGGDPNGIASSRHRPTSSVQWRPGIANPQCARDATPGRPPPPAALPPPVLVPNNATPRVAVIADRAEAAAAAAAAAVAPSGHLPPPASNAGAASSRPGHALGFLPRRCALCSVHSCGRARARVDTRGGWRQRHRGETGIIAAAAAARAPRPSPCAGTGRTGSHRRTSASCSGTRRTRGRRARRAPRPAAAEQPHTAAFMDGGAHARSPGTHRVCELLPPARADSAGIRGARCPGSRGIAGGHCQRVTSS